MSKALNSHFKSTNSSKSPEKNTLKYQKSILIPQKPPSRLKIVSLKLKELKISSKLEESKNPSFTKTSSISFLPKSNSYTTLPLSPTIQSLDSLNLDLKSVKILNCLNEKLQKILEICDIASKISSPFSDFIKNLKEEIQIISSSLSLKSCELKESSQAIKILKKRFQKLAIENLELNNLIVEKESKIFRLEQKNSEIKKISEVNKIQLEAVNNELKVYKDRYSKLKEKTLAYFQLSESNWKEIEIPSKMHKEKIIRIIDHGDVHHDNLVSMSFESQHQSIIIASNTSNYNSFLSTAELIDNLT